MLRTYLGVGFLSMALWGAMVAPAWSQSAPSCDQELASLKNQINDKYTELVNDGFLLTSQIPITTPGGQTDWIIDQLRTVSSQLRFLRGDKEVADGNVARLFTQKEKLQKENQKLQAEVNALKAGVKPHESGEQKSSKVADPTDKPAEVAN